MWAIDEEQVLVVSKSLYIILVYILRHLPEPRYQPAHAFSLIHLGSGSRYGIVTCAQCSHHKHRRTSSRSNVIIGQKLEEAMLITI
jgi:hypothetical protein